MEGAGLLATLAANLAPRKGNRGASSALAHEDLGTAARLQAQGGQLVVVHSAYIDDISIYYKYTYMVSHLDFNLVIQSSK